MTAPAPLPLPVLLRGSAEPLPARRDLRAGPLTLVLEEGGLRWIKLGELEVVRGIYCAVRDRNWGTVPARITELEVEETEDSFRVRYEVENRCGEVDFRWRGDIRGDAGGTIVFSMDGIARSTLERNRIGFCVLHPMRCAGAPCRVRRSDGKLIEARFPRAIAPRAPFEEIVSIAHQAAPEVWAELRFSGEVFEMEDQRNWSDASFKTFCTPLRIPFPVTVEAGTRIAQSVTLALESASPIARASSAPRRLTLGISPEVRGRLPAIGLQTASHGEPLAPREIVRLGALGLSHLRVDVTPSAPGHSGRLLAAAGEAAAVGASLDVALFLSDEAETELAALVELLEAERIEVARWLVFHLGELSTSRRWAELARRALGGARAAGVRIGSGTNANFTELNRGRPDAELLDFVCYSLQPQEHAFDCASLVETLEAQAVTVESARLFCGERPIAVSPVTLRRRCNPYATCAEPPPAPGELPSHVDPRQMSLFGACWTLGSVKYLAESGVESITYYETTGWRGVMETADGSPLPAEFLSIPGAVFPLYHVLADVGEFRGGEVLAARSSDPLAADGLALRRDGRTRVLVTNMTAGPETVEVGPLAGSVRVRVLDAEVALEAMAAPEEFRGRPGTLRETEGGALALELPPFAVARIDSTVPDR